MPVYLRHTQGGQKKVYGSIEPSSTDWHQLLPQHEQNLKSTQELISKKMIQNQGKS